MRGVLRSRSVWAHSRACAPACTPSTDSPHLPTQARAPALSPALRCPRRHAHLPAHQRVRADRAPARPHHHLPSAPRRADHQEGAGEHRRVQSHGDLRVAARDATCSSRRRVSGWVASALRARQFPGGVSWEIVFSCCLLFFAPNMHAKRPRARARCSVEPTAELSCSSDMNTPDCQSTNGSGAPNGSSPGSSRPWVLDPASISANVLGQSHPAQSSVTRTVEASLHLAFGLGSGWTLVDAMMIETARMGQTQPEGLALATVLSGWGTIANVVVVPLFYYLQHRLSWRIERWVWVGLLLQLSSAVLAALSWRGRLRAPFGSAAPRYPCLPGRAPLALGGAPEEGPCRSVPNGRLVVVHGYWPRPDDADPEAFPRHPPPQAGASPSGLPRRACTPSPFSPASAATSSSWRSCRGCRRAPRGPHASHGRWQAPTWARCACSLDALFSP